MKITHAISAFVILATPLFPAGATNTRSTNYLSAEGPVISVDFSGTDLNDVLKLLSDKMRRNIVAYADTKASITARLKEVPAQKAFEIILKTHNLRYYNDDGTFLVMDQKTYEKGGASFARGNVETVSLKEARASDVFKLISDVGDAKTG